MTDGLIAVRYPCECSCKCDGFVRQVDIPHRAPAVTICPECHRRESFFIAGLVKTDDHRARSWTSDRSDTRPRRFEIVIPEYDHHYRGCGPNPGRGPDAPDTCELCRGEGKVLVVPTHLTAVNSQQFGDTDGNSSSSVTLLAPVTLDDIRCPACNGDGAVY